MMMFVFRNIEMDLK